VLDGAFSTYRTLEAYMRRWVSIYVTIPGVARRVPGWAYPALGFLAVAYGGLRKGTRFFTAETFVSRLKLPVFFIHAEQDPFVRLEDAERLRARVRGPADLWVAEGAGHSESAKVQAREYRERILAFLRRHFSTAC
jgi:pimeloyl-ACP methyl ester carboxylesterase